MVKEKTFRIITLGCKMNQYESSGIEEMFENSGFHRIINGDEPDIVVINTCTVTAKTDRRSKQAIRQARRSSPNALIIATGCYAQRFPEIFSGLNDVDYVMGNNKKTEIVSLLEALDNKKSVPRVQVQDIDNMHQFEEFHLKRFSRYSRAFLKIQDGCNHQCSYCAVRLARGPSRSLKSDSVLRQFTAFVEQNYREIVLTGINLGSYGRDLSPRCRLVDIMNQLYLSSPVTRIRISSVEPQEWDDDLIDFVSTCPSICQHFHIPLQSGSDKVLDRMNRLYTREYFKYLVNNLHHKLPHACIGADVIVGFPNETTKDFEATVEVIKELPISYLHVFSYSPRQGTPAFQLKQQNSPEELKKRTTILREISNQKRQTFRSTQKDRVLPVLVLSKRDKSTGYLIGLTDNYINILFEGGDELYNTLQNVKITKICDKSVYGRLST